MLFCRIDVSDDAVDRRALASQQFDSITGQSLEITQLTRQLRNAQQRWR